MVRGSVDNTAARRGNEGGHLHKVGSKLPVLGVEADQALLEKKEGETVEIAHAYAATHPDPQLAGKPWSFECPLKLSKEKNWRRSMTSLRKIAQLLPLEELKGKLRGEYWKRP